MAIDGLALRSAELPAQVQQTFEVLRELSDWPDRPSPTPHSAARTLERAQPALGASDAHRQLLANSVPSLGACDDPVAVAVAPRGAIALGLRAGPRALIAAPSGDRAYSISSPSLSPISALAWCLPTSSRPAHALPLLALGHDDGSLALIDPSVSASQSSTFKDLRQVHPNSIQAIASVHLRTGPEIVAGDSGGNVRRHSLSPAGMVVRHRHSSLGVQVFAQDINCIALPSEDVALAAVETHASVAIVSLGADVKLVGRPARVSEGDPGPRACWMRDSQCWNTASGVRAERLLISWGKSATIYTVSYNGVEAERRFSLPFEPIALACLHHRLIAAVASVGSFVGLRVGDFSESTEDDGSEVDRVELGSYLLNERHGFASYGPLVCAVTNDSVFQITSRTGSATVDDLCQRGLYADALASMLRSGRLDSEQASVALRGLVSAAVSKVESNESSEDMGNGDEDREDVLATAAECCVQFCIASGLRGSLLVSGELPELFKYSGDRARRAFAQALWPHARPEDIASPELSSDILSPLQAHNDRVGMQRLLLNIPIECIDLDQGLRACKLLNLHAAFIRLSHEALSEYVGPIQEMLESNCEHDDDEREALTPRRIALVSIWLLSCGLSFPTGSSTLKMNAWKPAHLNLLQWLSQEAPSEPLRVLMRRPETMQHASIDIIADSVARLALNASAEELASSCVEVSGRLVHAMIHTALQLLESDRRAMLRMCKCAGELCGRSSVRASGRNVRIVLSDDDVQVLMELLTGPARSEEWAESICCKLATLGGNLRDTVQGYAQRASMYQVLALCHAWKHSKVDAFRVLLDEACSAQTLFSFLNFMVSGGEYVPEGSVCQLLGEPSAAERHSVREDAIANIHTLAKKSTERTAEFCMLRLDFEQSQSAALQQLRSDPALELEVLEHSLNWGSRAIMRSEGQTRLIELMCAQRPESVRETLVRTSECDMQRCLDATRNYRVRDATSLLLERVGDYEGALEVQMELLAEAHADVTHQSGDGSMVSVADLQLSEGLGVCLRGGESTSISQSRTTALWFRLLDQCVKDVRGIATESTASDILEQHLERALTRAIDLLMQMSQAGTRVCLFPSSTSFCVCAIYRNGSGGTCWR